MATVKFTSALERHVALGDVEVIADTVAGALGEAFKVYPQVRGYVLDDEGAVRKHIAIFVDGVAIEDRAGQSDGVGEASEIYVMQALSGG